MICSLFVDLLLGRLTFRVKKVLLWLLTFYCLIWAIFFDAIMANILYNWFVLWGYKFDIDSLDLLVACPWARKQTSLNRPLRVFLDWELFNLIHFICLYYVLLDAHCKPEHANDTQHMFIVVEKASLFREHHALVSCRTQVWSRAVELSFLHVTAVDFVKLPMMAIRVNYSCILDLRVDIVHML